MSGDERELRLAWQRHVGTGSGADHWFDTVIGAHRAPGRHYHDVRHVRWVVHHIRELAPAASVVDGDLDAAVAAGFFHDAVYDARASGNEAASAGLARRALGDVGWRGDAIDLVATMINATAAHDPDTDEVSTSVVIAADLGVLAAEPGRYGDYVRNVRKEYGHLDDAAWRSGRAAFVGSMLDRATIFPRALHLDAWERRARANLAAELAAMMPLSDERGASDAPEP